MQEILFKDKIEFEYVEKVIDSKYRILIADLAIRDKIAYRAAKKKYANSFCYCFKNKR